MGKDLNSLQKKHDLEETTEFDTPVAPVNNYAQSDSLSGLPAKQGLYDPDYEKDACGVGMLAPIAHRSRASALTHR